MLGDFDDNRLTLTACEPKFSAEKRIIVAARLVGTPVPELEGQDLTSAPVAIDDIDGQDASGLPTVLWGLAGAAVWLSAWLVVRLVLRRQRKLLVRTLPYVLGAPAFLVVLYFFFENVSRLLPTSY